MTKFRLPPPITPILLAASLLLLSCGSAYSPPPPPPSAGYRLVSSDEFNGTDGTAPHSSKWTYDTDCNGRCNHQLESYHNLTQNPHVHGGNLVITAMHRPS